MAEDPQAPVRLSPGMRRTIRAFCVTLVVEFPAGTVFQAATHAPDGATAVGLYLVWVAESWVIGFRVLKYAGRQ